MSLLQIVKKCRVCSDNASSFHYNGLTCASCKMFFRRYALRFEEFECSYSGTCEVNKHSRTGCSKCRLNKCFSIGMKMEMIESEQYTPKNFAESVIQENTKNDETKQNTDFLGTSKFIENTIIKNIQSIESEHHDLPKQDNIVKVPQNITRNCLKLNLSELKYIDELHRTTNSIFNFDEPKLPVLYEETNSDAALDLAESYIERIVQYCQVSEIFRSMPMAEQMFLLKQFIFDCMMIRYAYVYDSEKEGYLTIANQQANGAVLTKLRVFQDLTLVQRNQTNTLLLSAEMEKDSIVRDLLTSLVFHSSRSDISNVECMRYQYWTCHRLLLQYLQCKYRSLEKGQYKYAKLITIVSDLRDGKEAARLMFMKHQQQESVRHVALEIFDIGPEC